MGLNKNEAFVLGLDYGSDSCRAILIDAADGSEVGVSVMNYPRWAKGMYCNPASNQFRQHPQDYIDTLEGTVKEIVTKAGKDKVGRIKGIAIDTTGSTPCAVDREGTPLSLKPEFAENPSAMFVLWKDHTSIAETAKINELAKTWGGTDYTKFIGGVYSSEWFWAKIMRVFNEDGKVEQAVYSFLEHCEWMNLLLTGKKDVPSLKRSRCAMGHKAMWHQEFGGYPSAEFFSKLDPRLLKIRESLGTETFTSDQVSGNLSEEWARRLGLPPGIPVAVGAYDSHMGAVGGGAKPGWLVRVMGTSTCDMIVGEKHQGPEFAVPGICGQVDGSIIPGMIGYEAGQSSFGDVYAWFKKLVMWPLETLLPQIQGIDDAAKEELTKALSKNIIPGLEKAAESIDPVSSGVTALDWLNGRRTPNADQRLKAGIMGLTLGTDAPRVYRALTEATAFGARAIVECFREGGVAIEGIIGIGGVARKSPFVMQILADVINMPIHVIANDQTVALGAAIFAAAAAGLYPDVQAAQKAMQPPVEKIYHPDPSRVKMYNDLYTRYKTLGTFVEGQV